MPKLIDKKNVVTRWMLERLMIIALSSVMPGCGGGSDDADVDIDDPDGGAGPVTELVKLTIDSPTISEGNSGTKELIFTASLDKTDAADVSVDFTSADNSAIAGSDYDAINGSLIIPAGSTSATIIVTITSDTNIENDESFTLNLSNVSANATLVTSIATGTILNDDSAIALTELTVDSPSISEGNSGTSQLSFSVNLNKTDGADVSVNFATADISATAGSDYDAISGSLVIPAGNTSATINVTIYGDVDTESSEAFALNLSNISANATLITASATGTILNDDGISIPVAPTASFDIQPPKGIHLSWNAVTDATWYQVLKNPDGVSGFNIIADNLTSQEYTDIVGVHLHEWLNARYIVAACNTLGCSQSVELDTLGQSAAAIGYFKASNTDAEDNFGERVALSDDGLTLAVTARLEDSSAIGVGGDQDSDITPLSDYGAVYVFRNENGLWLQEAYIKASNADLFDEFGGDIALSSDGNTLAVSSKIEKSGATSINGDESDDLSIAAGAVYLFRHNGTAWSQQAYIKASNTDSFDRFGSSIALSDDGNTLAVGATGEASNAAIIGGDETNDTASEAGAVYTFFYDGSSWAQQAYIKASNAEAVDLFGTAVALSGDGNVLAVGAPGEASNAIGVGGNQNDNSPGFGFAGAAYVFTRTVTTWSQQAYIKASNTEGGDQFGSALALSSNGLYLVVGAPNEASNATGLNGDDSDNSAFGAGAVYTYHFDGSAWQTEAYLKASNTENGDHFGSSLGLNETGDILIIGAPDEHGLSLGINGDQFNDSISCCAGSAYTFTRDGTVWSQHFYIKAPNTEDHDYFGESLSISADGKTLAVGAWGEASAATEINGDQTDNSANESGAVFLY